jgi:2-(1,2-epoxy-1,2-dihydrophenyl)acetyl-CoA isomerase
MSFPSYDTLRLDAAGAMLTITLDRPDELNTMSVPMRDELGDCFDRLHGRRDVRVVVITGAGDAFSAGGDVHDFDGVPAEDLHDLMRSKSHRWFHSLWTLPQPTIAAVNGTAAGGGASLALATDLAIASDRARFGVTFVRLGLLPDLGSLFALPRVLGLRRAKELCFTGDLLTAQETLDAGIVNRVVPHDELAVEVEKLATRLATQPAQALAAMKAIMNRSFEQSMEEILLHELMGQSFLFGTADHREGLSAFLGRRRAVFGDRGAR